ncbi:unnamed protein product, partial [Mesorhabditis belari]|uniref:Cytochrome P450 n=1 Tax=Mesorhabditis belari TaxID=2138241 RepID=A0AAF3EEA3_9BILA
MFLILLVICVAGYAAAYTFFSWHAGYWKRRGIPGPKPRLFYGNWLEMDKIDAPATMKLPEWTKKYGKVYGIYEGIRKILVVSDPDLLQELFVKKFEYFHGRKLFPLTPNPDTDPRVHVFNARGQRWKRLRLLTNPSFSVNSLKKMRHTVEDSAKVMVKFMSKNADSGKGFNIHQYFQEYTLDVIARVAMGQEGTRQFENPATEWLINTFIRRIDDKVNYWTCAVPLFLPLLGKLFMATAKLRGRQFPKIFKMIEDTVEERKRRRDECRQKGETPELNDFIDLFLEAEADVDLNGESIDRQQIKVEKKLSTEEIVAQCFVFLLAGFDTTANSLAYVTHLLAQNPDKLEKLLEELDSVCGDDEDLTYEQLTKLNYMDCVIKEALRMYPLGAFANARTCMETTTLGDMEIEKGTILWADSWSVHYSKEIWGDDAKEFVPERWEEGKPRHQLAWFPFGAGPRQCIGMRLALMEEKMALAHLFRNFIISAGPETEKKLKLIGNFTLSPESVTLYLKKREML